MHNLDWMYDAPCYGKPIDWFFLKDLDAPIRLEIDLPGLDVCTDCAYRDRCLDYALTAKPKISCGIWGGTTTMQRRRLRKKRAA